MRLSNYDNIPTWMLRALDKNEQKNSINKRERPTYSLGNSPRAKEQSKEVFPQAPVQLALSKLPLRLGDYMPSPTMTNFLRILEGV